MKYLLMQISLYIVIVYVELNLLRQLNAELPEKNGMRREQIESLKCNVEKQPLRKSSAEVVTNIKSKPKRIPRVYIKN